VAAEPHGTRVYVMSPPAAVLGAAGGVVKTTTVGEDGERVATLPTVSVRVKDNVYVPSARPFSQVRLTVVDTE
jgi:hypothetical protein